MIMSRRRRWRADDAEAILYQKIARLYRSTHWQLSLDDLYETLTDVCQACGTQCTMRSIQLDHDHKTGEFRGWLCGSCNRTLGHARDDPGRLQSLVEYLERSSSSRSSAKGD
jgi:hypothetical protein